ncbi:uncharacterized protein B0I36DRAFT_360100 [Microdochium trichocladiopsis]|uniref:Zn(2)-C6 fungal-type domain-containing protein n=1 Tax=Microdochium trichocladiopsis TaxID=1682393 RepID=A0A9P8Y7Z1_9PEZI|nr:uncharacterized protein B0I36DRAFT_360100 [Microdochium trichocladiopsis]KAH7034594.1 hypothetical protein B0I36DRAFT_360100 [Microdochium trichocladiopsis]
MDLSHDPSQTMPAAVDEGVANHDGQGNPRAGPGSTAGANACLACRKIKMRCIVPAAGEAKCQRCARKSIDCIFRQHRRGRKPGTRITPRNKTLLPSNVPEPEALPVPESATTTTAAAAAADPPHDVTPRAYQDRQSASSSRGQSVHENADWETGALQPSGLLQHAVSHGQFSLRNILNAVDAAPSSTLLRHPENTAPHVIPPDDPVKLGLVTLSVASDLFQSFMRCQNPFINQLDPNLHTLSYVRQRSSFLTSAVLAVAAKGTDTPLYERLVDHAEDLLTTSFRQGRKSTETAQAVMVLTYWKKPEDNRAWISLGYAVRMGMELGWHRLHRYSSDDFAKLRSNLERLEARNIQRTWYILFVYDRSMSLQTGKPWMIERSDFIESIEPWCKDPMATPSDRLLGAFVTLRLLSSEVFKLLGPRSTRNDAGQVHRLDSFLSIIKGRLDEWESKWIRCVSPESCHPFLIGFYGAHLRLQLFSLPLQAVLGRRNANIEYNLEALWTSYSSAIEMLRLICRYPTHAHLAQDSVHVMTAYCAKFLIKLLLSVPSSIANEIESEVLQTIESAARALDQRISSPAQASCTLQAAFLYKVTANYVEKKASGQQRSRQTKSGRTGTDTMKIPSQEQDGAQTRPLEQRAVQGSVNVPPGSETGNTPSTTTSPNTMDTLASDGHNPQGLPGSGGGLFVDHNFSGLEAIFADDMTWSNVFPDGVFIGQDGGVLSM